MKKLILVLLAATIASCSKGGGGNDTPAATNVAATITSYQTLCSQYGYGSANSRYNNGYNNGYGYPNTGYGYNNVYNSSQFRPYNTGYPAASAGVGAGVGAGAYFNVNLGSGGIYGNAGYGAGVGYGYGTGYGYGYAQACTEAVTADFFNNVAMQCGYNGGTALYSTNCKNQFASFRDRNPNVNCSYNRYGIYGTLSDMYLIQNICTLNQAGL